MKAALFALALQLVLCGYSGTFCRQEIEQYLAFAEVMPEPIGGMKTIYAKIKYPESARQMGLEGNVYALAFINENGAADDVKIIKGLESNCDKEVITAISNSKFSPGMNGGKTVKVKLTLRIEFKLT